MIRMTRLFVTCCTFALALTWASVVQGTTITLTVGASGGHILGEVIPAVSSSSGPNGLLARDLLMINTLLDMGLNTRTADNITPEYYRSANNFGTLADAVLEDAVGVTYGNATATTTKIQITLDSAYMYLVGAWDGVNSGAQIWYIGDIAAGTIIEIPRYARPSPSSGNGGKDNAAEWPQNLVDGYSATGGSKYQLTSYTLFNPVSVSVPDGGTTSALLGIGVIALGFARRFRI
jgi:hypothetical protein